MKTLYYILLILAFICLPEGSHAEAEQLIIGVQDFSEYMPYSRYREGTYSGFNRDLLDQFARDSGLSFKYAAVPIKRLYADFLAQRIDLKYPDNPYWSADLKKRAGQFVIYSKPVVEYIDGIMTHPDYVGRGPDKLKALAIVAGFTPFSYLDKIRSGEIMLTEVFDYRNLLLRGIHKRVDGIYSNISVTRHFLKEVLKMPNALVFDPGLPYIKSTRHLSSIKHPDLIDRFDLWMFEKQDKIKRLKNKYGILKLTEK